MTCELLCQAKAVSLGPDLGADLKSDIDWSVVETYGLAKQGGAISPISGVRGHHPPIAALADTGELLHARLQGGNVPSGRGAATFVAEAISRVRNAGARGVLTVRAGSGFYASAVVSACRRAAVRGGRARGQRRREQFATPLSLPGSPGSS